MFLLSHYCRSIAALLCANIGLVFVLSTSLSVGSCCFSLLFTVNNTYRDYSNITNSSYEQNMNDERDQQLLYTSMRVFFTSSSVETYQ